MAYQGIPQSFVLRDLSSNVTMGVSGELITESIPVLTSDATAIFYVSLNSMRDVFQFQSDASNIDLIAGGLESDIKYFVNNSAFPEANPADASMNDANSVNAILSANAQGVALSTEQSTVAADFVRHLALHLFNTAYAEELFSNGLALISNITTICDTMWVQDISATLQSVGVSNDTLSGLDAASGWYYKDDSDATSANLCRELMAQLAGADPNRFSAVANQTGVQSVPFVAGDSINYLLKIHPAVGQHGLTGVAEIPARTYQIRMIMQ